jgi:hypothetical protein
MLAKSLALLSLIVPLLAAPANQNLQDQGPPKECEKPFGEGKLTTGANPYNFTVVAKQRSDASDYKKTFKGAPIDMIITFTAPPGAGGVKAFALRCGLPFPVVQWQNTADKQGKVVSCIAPQSMDTLVVQGNIGQRYSVAAVPLLAAWANHDTLPVIYEMAIMGGDGKIYVAAYNGTIKVKETDYKLPERFFRPPPGMQQGGQRGGMGQQGMQDPRMMQDPRFNQGQMGGMQGGMGGMGMQGQEQDQGFQRKRREAFDEDVLEDAGLRTEEAEELGN